MTELTTDTTEPTYTDLIASPETTDATDSPKPKTWKAKPTWAERKAAFAHHEVVLKDLAEQFPGIAPRGQACKPLKIGVHLDLAAALPDMTAEDITTFCKIYTAQPRYRIALIEGAPRVGLDGQSVSNENGKGIVTAADEAHAAKLMAHAEAKLKAARESKPTPVQTPPKAAQKPAEAKKEANAPKPQAKAEKPTVTPPSPAKSVAEPKSVASPQKTVAKAAAKRPVVVEVKKRSFTKPVPVSARKTA